MFFAKQKGFWTARPLRIEFLGEEEIFKQGIEQQ